MPFSLVLNAAASAVAGIFSLGKVGTFILKGALLLGAAYLLQPRRPDSPSRNVRESVETFSSGPARWVLGRQRTGGVVMYYGEDPDVKGTERRNFIKGGADDLHLIIGLSEGECAGIEAVWIGSDRFDVKFADDARTIPLRREQELLDENDPDYETKLMGLPLDLHPGDGITAYFNEEQDVWYESPAPGSRVLDENDPTDAETIRLAGLSGAVSIFPYMDASDDERRWRSVRHYTDDLTNRYLNEGFNLNNPRRATPFADEWTTDHKLQGIAGVHVRLRQWTKHNFDRRVFRNGIPNLSFLVKGAVIEFPDPDDTTKTRKEWTDNAAAIRYWWYTQRRGIPSSAIDLDSFADAYNVCSQQILPSRPTEWPNGVEPSWASDDSVWGFSKYSINGVLRSGDSPSQIENEFNDAWQGAVAEDGGKLYFYPGADRPAAATISSDDVVDDWPVIQPAPSLADRVNAVSMSLEQSSFHNYNQYALREIKDDEKRVSVDKDIHFPTDLGTWGWTINPAQAYMIGIINLRRARHSRTTSITLNPGTIDDPVKYLRMSPGLTYILNLPEHGLDNERVILLSKEITSELQVKATFIDSPSGMFAPNYKLPSLPVPPPYIPSQQGIRPHKPTDLVVKSGAHTSNDGSIYFTITASVDPTPMKKVWRLKAGDSTWESTTSDDDITWTVNVPQQEMEVTVRHIDSEGIVSLPIRVVFTPGYDNVILPTPRWDDAFFHGATLQMSWEPEAFTSGISGVEVRYVRLPNDSTEELGILTDENWLIDGELLATQPVQIIRDQKISVDALISESGRYNLFARFVSNVSGSSPIRGPISAGRGIAISIADDAIKPGEESPTWPGAYHNLYKWTSKHGNTKGESLLLPSHPIAGSTKAARRASLRAIPYDRWNGNVLDTSVTTAPIPAWPFGRCEGFGANLDDSNRDPATGLLDVNDGGNSTWYLTPPIDLGGSKRVDVRAEAYAYAPGTNRISTITFAPISFTNNQRWKAGTAIPSVVLPAVSAALSISNVTYSITGLPAGLSFNASTRRLSGTPTIASNGTATYTATDIGGGTSSLTFKWEVRSSLDVPGVPNNFRSTSKTHNSITLEWGNVSFANYFEIEYATSDTGPFTEITPVFLTSHTITDLDPSTTYHIRIRGVNGAGDGNNHSLITVTTEAAPTVPSAVTGLTLTDRTQNAFALRWAEQSNVEYYSVRWKLSSSFTYPASNILTFSSVVGQISQLLINTTYNVQVRASNEAGDGPWSAASSFSTLAQGGHNLLVSITESGADARIPHWVITTNTVAGETGTDVSVQRLNPPPGISGDPQFFYFPSGTGPFLVYHASPGITWRIGVRKNLSPLSGIGLQRYTDWYYEDITFTSVPERMYGNRTPRLIFNNTTTSSAQIRVYETETATSYRITYWPTSSPQSKVTTTVASPSFTNPSLLESFVMTLVGLDDDTDYTCTVSSRNAQGWSLESDPIEFKTKLLQRTPGRIRINAAYAISDTSAIINFDKDEHATSYQLAYYVYGASPSTAQVVNGITGPSVKGDRIQYTLNGLTPDVIYRIRIRGYNPGASTQYGPWPILDPDFRTPREPGDDPYTFAASPITMSTDSTNPRNIQWTFDSSNIQQHHLNYMKGILVEYIGHPSDPNREVREWTPIPEGLVLYELRNNPSQRTGTFDPGFSGRIWQMRVRVLIDDWIGGSDPVPPFDEGYSDYGFASNVHTLNNVDLNNAFKNGAKPFEPINLRVSQGVWDSGGEWQGYPWLYIDFDDANADFEKPTSFETNANNARNTIQMWINGRERYFYYDSRKSPFAWIDAIRWGPDGKAVSGTASSWPYWTRTNRITSLGTRGFISSLSSIIRVTRYSVGDSIRIKVTRTEKGRTDLSQELTYVITETPDVPATDPLPVSSVTSSVSGRDVTFTWPPVNQVDGYEVRLIEDEFGSTASTTTIVQTGTGRSWTKTGASNEHFQINVRTYKGDGDNRVYSPDFISAYNPTNPNAIGKITGLRASASGNNGADLRFDWNAVDNADGYERQYSDDNGLTWDTAHTVSTNTYTETNGAHAGTTMRLRAYKGSGNSRVFSTSYTTIRYTPLGDVPSGDLRPISYVVVGSRNGNVMIDWSSPDENYSPAPSDYDIGVRASVNNAWAVEQNNISPQVTAWQTPSRSDANDWQFRIRPQTDEDDGDWIIIPYTAEDNLPIGAASGVTASATYTTITEGWLPITNAQLYEIEYRVGTSGTWISWSDDIQETFDTISGLSPGTLYQVRVRGKEGSRSGAWSDPISIYTLSTRNLPPPSSVTLSTNGNTLRCTWSEVSQATGYEIRMDAKRSTASDYSTYRNVIIRTVGADVKALEIDRVDFGSYLNEGIFDVRVRVKALFNDSPTTNFSRYVSVRWDSSNSFVSPPGAALRLVPGSTSEDNAIVNAHHLFGVNGTLSLIGLDRNNGDRRTMFIRYTVAVSGNYIFRTSYTASDDTHPLTIMQLSDGNILRSIQSQNDSVGSSTITTYLNAGEIYIRHLLPTGYDKSPSVFTIQVNGPPIPVVTPEQPQNILTDVNEVNLLEGENATIKAKLLREPTSDTTVTITSNDTNVTTSPTSLTFTSSNWNDYQTVTISAGHDSDVENEVATISFRVGNVEHQVQAAVLDDDARQLLLSSNSLNAFEGEGDYITIRLTAAPIGVDTTVALTYTGGVQGLFSTASNTDGATISSLTFTSSNWSIPQKVYFWVIKDDNESNDTGTIKFTPMNGGYNVAQAKTADVNIIDLYREGEDVEALQLIYHTDDIPPNYGGLEGESDNSATTNIRVRLNRPPSSIIRMRFPTRLPDELRWHYFAPDNWDEWQSIPAGGNLDDNYVLSLTPTIEKPSGGAGGTDRITSPSMIRYYCRSTNSAVLRTRYASSSDGVLSVSEGSSRTISVFNTNYGTHPDHIITVSVTSTSPDVTITPSSQTINHRSTGDFIMRAAWDSDRLDDDAHITVAVTHTLHTPSTANITIPIKIIDRPQTSSPIIFSATTITVAEESTNTVGVSLKDAPSVNTTITVSSNNDQVRVSPDTLSFTPTNHGHFQNVTVSARADDNLLNDIATLTFTDGNNQNPVTGSVVVNIIDNDQAVIISNPTSEVDIDEGSTATLNLKLSHIPTSSVTLSITSGHTDLTLSASSLTFTRSNWNVNQSITITAAHDTDLRDETGNINITASGGGFGNVNRTIVVSIKDDERLGALASNWNRGGSTPGTIRHILTGGEGYLAFPGDAYTRIRTGFNRSVQMSFRWTPPSNGTYKVSYSIPGDRTYNTNVITSDGFTTSPSNIHNLDINEFIIYVSDSAKATINLSLTRNWHTVPSAPLNGGWISIDYDPALPSSAHPVSGAVKGAVAQGDEVLANSIQLNTSGYAKVGTPPSSLYAIPTFTGNIPIQCWLTGAPISPYQLPAPAKGVPPYSISIDNLPAGLSFDNLSRTISGTPTASAPSKGTATIALSDADGHTDITEMDYVIATAIPSSWSDFDGGLGQFNNPFQMSCTTKGNMRPFYYIQGGTNAQAIIDNESGARARAIWLKCPTTLSHTARILGAAATDYDLIVKAGDDWYISDTTDDQEFISVPGHEDGALIGIYRYESSTTATGVNNSGDPLILEWFPDHFHLPEIGGGGAVGLGASENAEVGGNQGVVVDGNADSDIYVLYRNNPTGPWTRKATPLGNDWVDVGADAFQIRFEVHLRRWRNRALRRLVHFKRDRE